MTHRVYFYTSPSSGGMFHVTRTGYSQYFRNGEYADLDGHYQIRPITWNLPAGSYYRYWTTSGGVTVSGNYPCPTPDQYCDLNVTGDGSITAYWNALVYRAMNVRTGISAQVAPGEYAEISVRVGDVFNLDAWQATPNGWVRFEHRIAGYSWHFQWGTYADGTGHASGANIPMGLDPIGPTLTRAVDLLTGNESGTIVFVIEPTQATITVNTSPGGLDAPYGGGTYPYGTTITIGVSPVPEYTFLHWLRDGSIYSYSLSFSYIVDTSRTFTAVFQAPPPQYTISVGTSPGGLDAPYGGGTYQAGQTAYIGVSSVGGYTFLYWTRDGSIYTYAQSFGYVVDANRTFTAFFQLIPQCLITVNTSPGGLDSPYGGGSYAVGTWISIGVSPVTGYNFVQWNRDGSYYTNNMVFSYQVDASHTFTAVFQAIPQYTIVVNTSPGGLDAPYGGGTYYQGTEITIGVTSVVGYTFLYWKRDGILYSYSQSFGYVVEAAHTFTAFFQAIPQFTITVNTSPTGLNAPSGGGTYYQGTGITISVSSVSGFIFRYWKRDGVLYTYSQSFGYTVDAARTFTAVFYRIRAYKIDSMLKGLGISIRHKIDAVLKRPPISIAHKIDSAFRKQNILAGIEPAFPYTFPIIFGVVPPRIDAVLKRLDISAGYGINVLIGAVPTLTREANIDAFLRALSISELYEVDMALERFGLINYHSDALLALRSHVSLATDAAIERLSSASYGMDVCLWSKLNMPTFFSVGMYLVSPQKFDLTLLFEQIEVESTFEGFEAEPSFEQFHVTPYFQEV